jgi:hypothetical protein
MSNYQVDKVIINKQKGFKIIIPKNKSIKPYTIPIESDIETSFDRKRKKIRELIKDINNDNNDFIEYLKNKFSQELEYYDYVNKDKLETLVCGGYVRYLTFYEELKYGGMLIKIINPEDRNKTKLLLKNSRNQMWSILVKKYHLFYKPHDVENQIIRELFINSEYYQ